MKKNPKVLFMLHIPPPIHGSSVVGKAIWTSNSINGNFDSHYINLLASQNVAESGKISLRKLLGLVNTIVELFVSLIKHRPQLCYMALSTTGPAIYKDTLLVALLKIFKIKRVYHLHNKGVSKNLRNPINRLCYRYVFKNASVILLSKLLYYDIEQFVPEDKVYICPNGVVDEVLIPKSEVEDLKKSVRILFLSNLIKSKGVLVLLDACEILFYRKVLFECVFAGGEGDITGSQFNRLIHQKGLASQVFYQGNKYEKEKKQAFSEADIFALPTYYECFPLVLLEAMSHSLPVVATFEGGIQDIVEDKITGFLVPQRSAETLAEKLELLLKNPVLRREMGQTGRHKYEQEFTLEIFEEKLVDIIRFILSKNEKS